jgi:hypothetical protein
MLALVRPGAWNLPLFLHVLGATLAFGSIATVAIVGFAGHRADADRALWLRGLAFRIALVAVVPAWLLMRVAGQWIDGKEYPNGNEPGWVGVGFLVSDVGALVIIVLLIVAWLARRSAESRLAIVVPWLAALYAVALGVAWFAMSGKPGS